MYMENGTFMVFHNEQIHTYDTSGNGRCLMVRWLCLLPSFPLSSQYTSGNSQMCHGLEKKISWIIKLNEPDSECIPHRRKE